MKIYTSYFGNLTALNKAGIIPVSIAVIRPAWYKGLEMLILAPSRNWLKLDEDSYRYVYGRKLAGLNAMELLTALHLLTGGKDLALVCYEKEGFCHRHLVAEWLKSIGQTVTEFKAKSDVQIIQPTLF
jgi:hypothetical protein